MQSANTCESYNQGGLCPASGIWRRNPRIREPLWISLRKIHLPFQGRRGLASGRVCKTRTSIYVCSLAGAVVSQADAHAKWHEQTNNLRRRCISLWRKRKPLASRFPAPSPIRRFFDRVLAKQQNPYICSIKTDIGVFILLPPACIPRHAGNML